MVEFTILDIKKEDSSDKFSIWKKNFDADQETKVVIEVFS